MTSALEYGIIYEGERIRKNEMLVELGGTKNINGELCEITKDVKDGQVKVHGKKLADMKKGSTSPVFIHLKVSGKKLKGEFEPVVERRIHEIMNCIHGVMHIGQRDDVWVRISTEASDKGLKLEDIGKALIENIKKEFKPVEKAQVDIHTEEKKVKELVAKAVKKYEERDARVKGMKDADVDTFYGCTMCQSFAPSHACVISPNRISLCGATSWFDAKAAAELDPHGNNFPVPKGKVIDAEKGEYEGVNKVIQEKSGGKTKRIFMYSMFGYPHTSCGCFESVAFYIPEVDGIGIVHRKFQGEAVNGLGFGDMASQTGGGIQTEGFLGMGLQWMRSPKFFSADGGWNRIVYMPNEIKEKYKDAIPKDIYAKIATEKDVKNNEELKEFLKKKAHPVVERWGQVKDEKQEEKTESGSPLSVSEAVIPGSGVTLVLKNAKIYAEKMIIKKD